MLMSKGYYIEYHRDENQIVIGLPQTMESLTNTVEPVSNRKADIFANDLALILSVVQYMFERDNG